LSPLVFVIDLWPDLADQSFNLATGDILNAYTYDTTHLNVAGSYLAALRFLQSIGWSSGSPAALYPPQSFLLESASDLFDATNLRSGNLVANGMLGGTSGGNSVSSFGVSGSFPTSWTASNVSSGWQSGSPTLVGSQQTNGRGNWWQAVLGGTTGSGTNPSATISQSIPLANLGPGDVLRMAADFEVDASAAGFTCPYIELSASLPGGSNTVRDFHPSDGDIWGPSGLIQGAMRTPPLTVAGAETAVTARLVFAPLKSSSPAATIRFRKLRVWKEI
jgi:hypothetical protein